MKTGMRGGPLAGLIAIAIGLVACGGGSSGPPKTLSLSGEKVPVSEVTTAYSQMCGVVKDAVASPASAVTPFASAEGGLNLLATVLAKDHGQESQRLLAVMQTFLSDIGQKTPAASSGEDATNLLATAKEGLQALKITPPAC